MGLRDFGEWHRGILGANYDLPEADIPTFQRKSSVVIDEGGEATEGVSNNKTIYQAVRKAALRWYYGPEDSK